MKGPRMLSFIRKYLPLVSDFLIMMILTLVFIIMSVWNLGRISVPVTTAYLNTSGDEGFYIDLYDVEKVKSVVFLVKKNQGPVNIKMCTGYPVNSYCKKENLEGYYKWRSISFEAETQRILFVFDSSRVEIAEIAVIGEVNKIIPIKSITGNGIDSEVLRNLIDEQDKIEYPSTYISETYFDEIYFVRTAEEYLRLEEPFEWTHPPLGKLIIALGILVFGYSPFGWRIMGVIFAGLMIPVMYLLGKRLFGTRRAAFISAFLWVFEFMHFTMGRISTVDTYVTFFSLISHLFFLIYLQGVLKGKPNDRNLLLAVIFFALGFSTKWITIYGFIGDVLLLLMLRFKTLSKTGLKWAQRVKELFNYPVSTLAGFIIFAIVIYFTTFIPYMMIGHSLIDVFSLQWSMSYYHATLKATHPIQSPWWSWPISQKT
ncbi:MAG: glycosyltransferase family 39 protein, partial [Thermoproteota archaeon]